jgi:hypothetical protein
MFKISISAVALTAMAALAPAITAGSPAFAHEQATFTVTIAGVADNMTLKLPDGGATGAPIAPGAYAVVEDGTAIFAAGEPTMEDGLESLAEDGNSEAFIAHLKALPGVVEAGMFVPGQPFHVTVRSGERLAFAAMFVQSNDTFIGVDPRGLALFDDNGRPIGGDETDLVHYWDAGTEVDEAPGVGPDQAPRQAAANTGATEGGNIVPQDDAFNYPAIPAVVRLTVSPQ